MQVPYLVELATRLQSRLQSMPDEWKDRHARFIQGYRQPDGGFSGREGDSDLYYTSFAVRGLALLDRLDGDACTSVTAYLRTIDWRTLGVIDLMNWLATALAIQVHSQIDLLTDEPPDWPDDVAARLETVRTSDGGYAKASEGASGSTYHTFLVVLTYELIGRVLPDPNAVAQFLFDRQRDDGGFVEIAPMRRSGTNPTAAAAALLHRLGYADEELKGDLAAFFKDVRSDEGGFQANSRVPFSDSLSTFTAVLTCQDYGLGAVYDPERIGHWLSNQLEFPTGGYRAATWDAAADVEYTFYGLALQALVKTP